MKRALILAYYYPPIASSGSLRPVGFSNHLAEYGYIPHVISTDLHDVHPPVSIDPSLERLIPEGVRVDRLTHVNLLKELLDFRGRLRERFGVQISANQNNSGISEESEEECKPEGVVRQLKTALFNRIFLFPDHQKPWISAVLKHVQSLDKGDFPDLVYATGNPWSGLVAGQKVAEMLDIPFIADFRDPWTRNPKAPLSKSLGDKALKLERSVVSRADRVIANTEELRQAFVQDYPDLQDKFVTITNGYNDVLMSEENQIPSTVESSATIELSHFGSVYELRNPLCLLQAVNALVAEGRIKCGDLRLRFIGQWLVEDSVCNRLVEGLESAGYVTREQPLAHEAYLQSMKSAQHLLILQQAFPLQIPGKIYEYVATGRPLVVVGGEGATASLINTHGLGVSFPNIESELKRNLMRMVEGQLSIKAAGVSQIEHFSYSALTEQLAGVFDEAVSG